MNSPKILLLSGYKRSGKDSVANYLNKELGLQKLAFADRLKDLVAREFNIERNLLDDQNYKESPLSQYPVNPQDSFSSKIRDHFCMDFRTIKGSNIPYWTPRTLMMFVGSMGRAINPNHWVDEAFKCRGEGNIVVSDFRYRSEFQRTIELFGKENVTTMRIERNNKIDTEDDSERNLDNFEFDSVIENNNTLEELFKKVHEEMLKYGF